jgi:two-component system LytT family response regulator
MLDVVRPAALRAMIVDDEPLGRLAVRQQLERHPAVRVVAECENAREAIGAIAECNADILFLDIQLPLGDGFDVVDAIGGSGRPAVVFVTAYNEHAVRAFDVHAVDYLLKPIEDARFDEALQRVRQRLASPDVAEISRRLHAALRDLSERERSASGRGKRLTIHDGRKVLFLWTGEIDWLEAEGNYVRVHAGRRKILARGTLQHMVQAVSDPRFVRVHRSSIVNSDAVSRIEPAGKGLYVLVLRDGSRVESSYHYRQGVMRLIGRG